MSMLVHSGTAFGAIAAAISQFTTSLAMAVSAFGPKCIFFIKEMSAETMRNRPASWSLSQPFQKISVRRVDDVLQFLQLFGSPLDGLYAMARLLRQIQSFVGYAINNYNGVPAVITDLHGTWSPNAVGGFIISIIVYALESIAFGARSHILKKIKEAIPPALAHAYSAPSIMLEVAAIWIQASLLHCGPNRIDRAIAKLWPYCDWASHKTSMNQPTLNVKVI